MVTRSTREEHNVQVTDFEEILAVWEGHIEGFVYDDGEVWADAYALEQWRLKQALVACRSCGILSRTEQCPNCAHTESEYRLG